MNNQRLENNVRQNVANLKKDLNTMQGDRAAHFGKFEANVNKAGENLISWVDDGVSQLGVDIEKLSEDAKRTAVSTAAVIKKDVGQGLSQYNAKAQEYANKVPGDFGKKASRYPWVAMTITLVLGFMLGRSFK